MRPGRVIMRTRTVEVKTHAISPESKVSDSMSEFMANLNFEQLAFTDKFQDFNDGVASEM
jgi:hypothetical protein